MKKKIIFFMRIVAGALICWLVLVTVSYEATVKSAVAEFVIVGGLGLYLAASLVFYFFIPAVAGLNLQLRPPWLPFDRSSITITMGDTLFGYELLMLITRLVRSSFLRRKSKRPAPESLPGPLFCLGLTWSRKSKRPGA